MYHAHEYVMITDAGKLRVVMKFRRMRIKEIAHNQDTSQG